MFPSEICLSRPLRSLDPCPRPGPSALRFTLCPAESFKNRTLFNFEYGRVGTRVFACTSERLSSFVNNVSAVSVHANLLLTAKWFYFNIGEQKAKAAIFFSSPCVVLVDLRGGNPFLSRAAPAPHTRARTKWVSPVGIRIVLGRGRGVVFGVTWKFGVDFGFEWVTGVWNALLAKTGGSVVCLGD